MTHEDQHEDNPALEAEAEYVDPSKEEIEGEEEEQVAQKVQAGLHPMGAELLVTGRDGSRASVILQIDEIHALSGTLNSLAAFHMFMAIQSQMQQAQQIQQMMQNPPGVGQPERTKSGIYLK